MFWLQVLGFQRHTHLILCKYLRFHHIDYHHCHRCHHHCVPRLGSVQICFARAPHLIWMIVLLPNSLQPAGRIVNFMYCCNVCHKAYHGVNTQKLSVLIYIMLFDILLLNSLPRTHRTSCVNLSWFQSYLPSVYLLFSHAKMLSSLSVVPSWLPEGSTITF